MNSEEYRDLKGLIEEIDGRLVASEGSVRAEIQKAAAETCAHFDLVAEKFREDVRKVAEGYGHHATVLDDHEVRLTQLEQGRLRFDS